MNYLVVDPDRIPWGRLDHVDLTPGSDTLRFTGGEDVFYIGPAPYAD